MVDNEVAALFVSEGGELGCFPDHTDERFFYLGPTRWDRLSVPYFVPAPVAAGILRLLRERDRLREALKRYGAHGPRCLLGGACSCGLASALSDLVA